MLITRVSMFTQQIHTMDLDITTAQMDAYKRGTLLQNAFPNLTAAEREFYKTGVTAEEWDAVFKDDDPDLSDDENINEGQPDY